MRESIRGFADAVLTRAAAEGRRAQLAAEVDGFRSVVDGSEDLRRVLADPGVPAHARRSVVTDLLASRASDDAVRLIGFVLTADRATEVVDDIRWVAARARRDEAPDDGPHGRAAALERIGGYAAALLETVPRARLGDLEDELFRFARVVGGSEELGGALTDRAVPASARQGLVADLLSGRASAEGTELATYAARVGRPRDYVDNLDWLVARVAAEADRRVAEVRAAVPLDDDQRRRLAAALARIIGHGVDLRVSVDTSVLGGFVATVGDTVIDGSARHRLELLKERLVVPEASLITTAGTTDTGEST